jgi:hypothetical protein
MGMPVVEKMEKQGTFTLLVGLIVLKCLDEVKRAVGAAFQPRFPFG